MQGRPNTLENPILETDESSGDFREIMYLVVQVIGVLIVIAGIYFAVNIFFKVIKIVDDPSVIAGRVAKLHQTMDIKDFAIETEHGSFPIGRVLSMLFYIFWYAILVQICVAVIKAGGYIASSGAAERRLERALSRAILKIGKAK